MRTMQHRVNAMDCCADKNALVEGQPVWQVLPTCVLPSVNHHICPKVEHADSQVVSQRLWHVARQQIVAEVQLPVTEATAD